MKMYLLAGFGGMLGSMLRLLVSSSFLQAYPTAAFPWGTFAVNLSGCLLIGLVAGVLESISSFNAELRLFLITGILGGFTTFSAFGIESVNLMRSGNTGVAATYVVGSVLLGLAFVWVGLKIAMVVR